MTRLPALLVATLAGLGATGCAFTRGPSLPGTTKVHRIGDGTRTSAMGYGAKIGIASGAFGDRDRAKGLGPAGLHLDYLWFPSDRVGYQVSFAYHAESVYYDDDHQFGFSGWSPEAAAHYGLTRRLSVHAGAGIAFGHGNLTIGDGDPMSEGTREIHAFAGFTYVYRRTPLIDIAFRTELGAFSTGEVTLGGETGSFRGQGVMFEGVFSYFPRKW